MTKRRDCPAKEQESETATAPTQAGFWPRINKKQCSMYVLTYITCNLSVTVTNQRKTLILQEN